MSITLQFIGITFNMFGNTLTFFHLTDSWMERRDAAPVFDGKVVRRKATISDGTRGRSTLQKPPFLFASAGRKGALLSRDSRCGREVLYRTSDAL
jgi:hypothetical protein